MRSKAHLSDHPIHPMLVAFPIAFLTSAFAFDAAGFYFQNSHLWTTAGYVLVLGIVSGFAAAIPGIVDYVAVVPPKSVGKSDAAKHGIVNTLALTLFIAAACLHHGWRLPPTPVTLVLEGLGALALAWGGWLGGELSFVDHFGVQTYYANEGAWDEAHVKELPDETPVADAGDLQVDQMKLIHLSGRRIVLARTADGYSAFDDRCPHQGGSLADGALVCGTVQCPWHGSQFDAQTGTLKKGPSATGIRNYPAVSKNGKIFIQSHHRLPGNP